MSLIAGQTGSRPRLAQSISCRILAVDFFAAAFIAVAFLALTIIVPTTYPSTVTHHK
jgi:hypothetical protein